MRLTRKTSAYIANRLDSVIYSDSTLPTVYRYDYAGRVETVFDESGRMDYTYGNMGEVKSETRTYALPFLATDLALTTQYEYDSWGRTTSITYPDGETVSYDYDRGGQLFKMSNYLDSVLYDKFGAVTSRKYGNGLKMQYAYHPQNRRLTGITTLNGNSQLSHTAYTYDATGNITQAVSSYPWLAGQTFTETFSYDSTNQLVSAANAQTYALSVTYGDWGKIQQYGLSQTDLANNLTTSVVRNYNYGSLNEGQTTFAPNNINYTDGTNVNEQYGIGGSLLRRETTIPDAQPETEHYRFTANGNLQAYMYENLLYVHYGYDGGTTRTYKYSFDLNPNWVNGHLESVNFNPHTAMFYPNSYLNFNSNGYYTKHYYNGMERIASRLGDQNLPINVNDPDLQDRKDWQDSLIRKNVTEITGYEFLPVGEEQTLEDPKPVFELPQVGMTGLQPISNGDVYYYHPNHLGSTCYVTDENATVQQGFLYAPFGEITNEYNSGWQNGNIPKYAFNAKELDEETGMYYYEARYMAPPVFISRDPLFEKYPTFSPYAYCANNPIKYIDPDGMDVYLLFYANSDKMFEAAAETRKREIETSRGFNRKKDIVIMNEFSDIGEIESLTKDAINKYSIRFGETVEVGIWSHASLDGPRGEVETTGDYASGRQMTLEGWNNIDFNWNRNNANILFYGCNTGNEIRDEKWDGSFARKISKQRNFKDVNVWGQQTSAFPSFYPNIRAINLARNYNFGYWVDCNIYMVGGDKDQVAKSLWFTPGDYPKAKPMNVYKNGQLIRTAFQNR